MTDSLTTIVRAYVDAINAKDLDKMASLMDENFTYKDSGGGFNQGKANMLKGWREYFGMFPDFTIQADLLFSEGDTVAMFGATSGTYKTDDGLLPENKTRGPAAWQIRLQDGKIALWQVYTDFTEAIRIVESNQKSN